jgi:hypothetical protein
MGQTKSKEGGKKDKKDKHKKTTKGEENGTSSKIEPSSSRVKLNGTGDSSNHLKESHSGGSSPRKQNGTKEDHKAETKEEKYDDVWNRPVIYSEDNTKVCADDFELLAVIGKGSFGKVSFEHLWMEIQASFSNHCMQFRPSIVICKHFII